MLYLKVSQTSLANVQVLYVQIIGNNTNSKLEMLHVLVMKLERQTFNLTYLEIMNFGHTMLVR